MKLLDDTPRKKNTPDGTTQITFLFVGEYGDSTHVIEIPNNINIKLNISKIFTTLNELFIITKHFR